LGRGRGGRDWGLVHWGRGGSDWGLGGGGRQVCLIGSEEEVRKFKRRRHLPVRQEQEPHNRRRRWMRHHLERGRASRMARPERVGVGSEGRMIGSKDRQRRGSPRGRYRCSGSHPGRLDAGRYASAMVEGGQPGNGCLEKSNTWAFSLWSKSYYRCRAVVISE